MKKMKKIFLLLLLATSFVGYAQNYNGQSYRSRVTDSTTVTYPTGWGVFYYNAQSGKWRICNGAGVCKDVGTGTGGGGGAITSVFGRTGIVVAATNDYTFAQIGSKPTTLSGYGITDGLITTLTPGNIYVGNGSSVATGIAVSGDGTLSSGGVLSVTKILGNTIPSNASGVLTNNGSGALTWSAAGGGGTWGSITGTLSSQTDLQAALNAKQASLGYTPLDPANNLTDVVSTSTALKNIGGLERLVTYNTQTGDYTLLISDATASTEILMNKATAQVLTVPPNSTAAIAIGTTILGRTIGVGVTTFTPGAGVTINSSSGGLVSPGQYILWSLQKTGTNTWYLDNGGSLFNIANSQLSNMANYTIKGRFTASTGVPEDLTEDQLRRINFNTQKYYRLYSDFTGSTSEFSSGASGTGATINYTADGGDTGHPGVVTLPTGTTTTGTLGLRNGSLSTITFTDGSIYFDGIVKVSAASDATDTYTIRVGLGQNTSADGSESAFFRYTHGTNSGKWQTVTRHTSAETANDAGGSAIAASTYYRLTILSNSANTSYGFYLNGTLVQTHTNNLPLGQGSVIVSITKSAGTTSRSLGVDMVQVIQELSTSR